jgi:hypothetical protein
LNTFSYVIYVFVNAYIKQRARMLHAHVRFWLWNDFVTGGPANVENPLLPGGLKECLEGHLKGEGPTWRILSERVWNALRTI